MSNNVIPNKLREYRKKAGLSQIDVMQALGFKSTDRISKWETGSKMPSLLNGLRLAELYKVEPRELFPEI